MEKYNFYKDNPTDKVFWVDNPDTKGEFLFSFDKKKIYNLFADYPHNLSKEEKKIFDKENPYWVEFFKERMFPKSVIKCAEENGFEHIGSVKQYREESDLKNHNIYIAFHNTPDDEDGLIILEKGNVARPATSRELDAVLTATFPPCI